MGVTKNKEVPWLLLVFSLPARSASQRVQIWRKLQRYGMLALRSSGYVLPNTAANQERMEWLATAIRTYKGQASVVQVQGFDDLPADRLQRMFVEARSRDYQKLLHEVKKLLALSPSRRPGGRLNRIRRRFLDLQDIDFFENRLRTKLENLLAQADESDAIPFDMFCPQGFGHRGEDCTFETLFKQFAIRDRRVKRIAEIIHDADLGDEKFGRPEGHGLDKVLNGWAQQELPDDELLQRGMDLIEGLYHAGV